MNLRQLVRDLESHPKAQRNLKNEKSLALVDFEGLQEVANALDLKLVYILLPNKKSLQEIIEDRKDIGKRNSHANLSNYEIRKPKSFKR